MKVTDTGPFGSNIMLVGEAPGAEEVKKGEPFVGQSGQLLKNMLIHVGIKYQNCYVTNIIQERPPGNKFEYFYEQSNRKTPRPILLKAWKDLQEKVKAMKPNIVIALGAEPLRALTNRLGIRAWRGIIQPCLGTKVIATYHPAAILRKYEWHPIFELDAAKAKRHSTTFGYTEPPTQITLKPTIHEVLAFINNIKKRVGFDIETVDKHIRCMGLATGPISCPKAITIPFISFSNSGGVEIKDGVIKVSTDGNSATSYWRADEELLILDAINGLFTNSSIEKVSQNGISFDAPLIKRNLMMVINNHYLDTMHAHHDLYSELPMSLNFLCSMYTDYPNYWTDKVTTNDMSEWHYCAMDSIICYVCSYKLEQNLIDSGMSDYYFKHRLPLSIALAEAQFEGLDIDEERRSQLIKEQTIVLTELKEKITTIAKGEINPNSSTQMKHLLYEVMGYPKIYMKGKVTTDENALRTLEQKFPEEPILDHIIMYRKTQKLISTYLRAKKDEDGKMRTSWNPSGTETGRISSSKTIWKTGITMQNIPKGISRGVTNIRDIFIAGRTKCLCQ